MSRYPCYIPAHLYGIHKLTKTKLTPIIVINILNFEKRLIYLFLWESFRNRKNNVIDTKVTHS